MVREKNPHDSLHFWHQLQVWGIPKRIFSFDNSLEGLTELTESYYTYNYSLLQQKNTD